MTELVVVVVVVLVTDTVAVIWWYSVVVLYPVGSAVIGTVVTGSLDKDVVVLVVVLVVGVIVGLTVETLEDEILLASEDIFPKVVSLLYSS